MRPEQYIWHNGRFDFFRRPMCKARLWIGANVCIGPSVKGALFDMREGIGRKIVPKSIALWNPCGEPSGGGMECESGRIAHTGGQRRLPGAIWLEALYRGLDLRLYADVARRSNSYKHSPGFWI